MGSHVINVPVCLQANLEELGGRGKNLLKIQIYYRYPSLSSNMFKSNVLIIANMVNFERKIFVGYFVIKHLGMHLKIFVFPITFNSKQKIPWV